MEEKTLSATRNQEREILVEVNNVTKIFSRSIWAIKKINLQIYRQDAIAIVGRNGSGKTALAQLIGNIAKQTSGNIDYFFNHENIFQAIGYQSREQSWPVGFRVQDVINLYVAAFEVKDKTWIAKLVEVFDIEEIKDRKLNKLNILSLQLFAIFLVLLYRPEMLVIDELSSTIAFEKKMKILNLLKEYRAGGGTLVIVQPEDFIINALCNRIITLDRGEIQDDLKLNKVLKEYGSTFEYIRQLSLEAKTNQKQTPINRSFEIIFRKYREVQDRLEQTYREQFNNNFRSGDKELDLDIRNAIYYVDLGYESLLKALNEKATQKSVNETVKILKRTVRFLHETLHLFKKHHSDFHNDVRFKKVELELKRTLYLIEEKILPILKNNQFFTNIEEIETETSTSERKQLKSLKRRYIREEIRIMKIERKLKQNQKRKRFWNKQVSKPHIELINRPLQGVVEILKDQVDATVVIGPDETIELVTKKPGQVPKLELANPKKSSKTVEEDPTLKNATIKIGTKNITEFFDDDQKKAGDE